MTLITSQITRNSEYQVYSGATIAAGQSFTPGASEYTLTSVKFSLRKQGSPTGNAVAKLYAHTGVYGTSSKPTGAAIATSNNLDVSGLTTSFVDTELTFASPPTLSPGTNYVIVIEYSGGSASNRLEVGLNASAGGHAGNCSYQVSSWTAEAYDLTFYIYGNPAIVRPTVTTQAVS